MPTSMGDRERIRQLVTKVDLLEREMRDLRKQLAEKADRPSNRLRDNQRPNRYVWSD